ncbi:MAG: alpha/beta fold hydrolase [Betaproteobacteria bacterium AqS2]|uniref:Alpha/beta fold hydrolase n=1 Tax=Candidatus Amphirhobacter heronislandensis TaxID=1732024 RepID=A0A930UDN0_9GAMM|nr:alpha/beta fold hydrolase [Betaproteobacteria bacterium AqS2]
MDAATFPEFARPWWLCSTHLETVWARRLGPHPTWRRELASTPDGDVVAFDFLDGEPGQPRLVMFHGLEGCSRSHTVRQCAAWFNARGWSVAVPHFRSCGVMNRLPRAYHAGDTADCRWMLNYARLEEGPTYAAGVSLGGNVLAKFLGENPGQDAVRAAAAVCPPVDLASCARRLDRRFNRMLYGGYFMRRLRAKMLAKIEIYPFLAKAREIRRLRSIRDFDARFTAPLHGFESADDYYAKASAQPLLAEITTPLLLVESGNDALIPPANVPSNPAIETLRTRGGGHAGFVSAPFPGRSDWLAQALHAFFSRTL